MSNDALPLASSARSPRGDDRPAAGTPPLVAASPCRRESALAGRGGSSRPRCTPLGAWKRRQRRDVVFASGRCSAADVLRTCSSPADVQRGGRGAAARWEPASIESTERFCDAPAPPSLSDSACDASTAPTSLLADACVPPAASDTTGPSATTPPSAAVGASPGALAVGFMALGGTSAAAAASGATEGGAATQARLSIDTRRPRKPPFGGSAAVRACRAASTDTDGAAVCPCNCTVVLKTGSRHCSANQAHNKRRRNHAKKTKAKHQAGHAPAQSKPWARRASRVRVACRSTPRLAASTQAAACCPVPLPRL